MGHVDEEEAMPERCGEKIYNAIGTVKEEEEDEIRSG